MFRWILLFVLVVPALEIGIFIWAGGKVGPWWVIFLIILTGVVGAWLARKQGMETLFKARQSIATGQLPHTEIFDGVCILVGAAFLLTPGFITDAIGFCLLLPSTRRPIKRWMQKTLKIMMDKGTVTIINHRRR
ncbi:FxsA family protein [Aquibacillus albus]|uniref:UPF0716 protein FxsA n=1 Tax=Aquibacillus albus TaxID=1168171 RepID=A0ABS2N415_9BACI|nr:UPF0716 protein FxsA [Aquibacillus albus]